MRKPCTRRLDATAHTFIKNSFEQHISITAFKSDITTFIRGMSAYEGVKNRRQENFKDSNSDEMTQHHHNFLTYGKKRSTGIAVVSSLKISNVAHEKWHILTCILQYRESLCLW